MLVRLLQSDLYDIAAALKLLQYLLRDTNLSELVDGKTPTVQQMLAKVDPDMGPSPRYATKQTVQDMRNLVEKATNQRLKSSNINPDLLDTIINLWQEPFLFNQLGPDTVKAIREAIMIPEALRELKKLLAEKQLRCSACHRDLVGGEMVVLNTVGTDVALFCCNCDFPTRIACKCRKSRSLSSKPAQEILKHECEHSKEEESGIRPDPIAAVRVEVPEDPNGPVGPQVIQGGFARVFTGLRNGVNQARPRVAEPIWTEAAWPPVPTPANRREVG